MIVHYGQVSDIKASMDSPGCNDKWLAFNIARSRSKFRKKVNKRF